MNRRLTSPAVLLAASLLMACGSTTEPPAALPPLAVAVNVAAPDDGPRRFAYVTIDGRKVTSANYRGRMTLIAFAATYDIASQAQARYLNGLVRRHAPRVNALLIVMEPEHHRPLVEAYVSSLSLHFDVALADPETLAGDGPFPGLHHVPAIVLLDRQGREVWRNLGLVDDRALSETVSQYDDAPAPRSSP